MTSRRTVAHCRRRGAHSRMRNGGIVRQEGQSSAEGPSDSPKAQKAAKAWKARKA
jgi:hypothetical protein